MREMLLVQEWAISGTCDQAEERKKKVKYNVLYEKETKPKQFNHPAITWMNKNQHVREHVFEVKHSQKIQRQHNLKEI